MDTRPVTSPTDAFGQRLSLFADTPAPAYNLAEFLGRGRGFDATAYADRNLSEGRHQAQKAALRLLARVPSAIGESLGLVPPRSYGASPKGDRPPSMASAQPGALDLAIAFHHLRTRMQAQNQWGALRATDKWTPLGELFTIDCTRLGCAVGAIEYSAIFLRQLRAPSADADTSSGGIRRGFWEQTVGDFMRSAYHDIHLFLGIVAESNCHLWSRYVALRQLAEGQCAMQELEIRRLLDTSQLDARAHDLVQICEPFLQRLVDQHQSVPQRFAQWFERHKTLLALRQQMVEHWMHNDGLGLQNAHLWPASGPVRPQKPPRAL